MEIQYSDRISGTKPYPFAEIDKKVTELRASGQRVVDFGVGDPSSPTPDFVIEALIEAGKNHATTGYPSYIGSSAFRQAAAGHMQATFGVQLDPNSQISSTIGSKEAVFNFPLGFLNPGDIVICPTPGYPVYKTGTEFAGGTPYMVPLLPENNFLIDLKAIPDEIAQKAKIIWTNYPNSPTGVSASKAWLEELLAWSRKHNVIIAADEGCYIDIYFGEQPSSILQVSGGSYEGIITFYSLSKRNNMTGYRTGFVAGDERIVSGFKKVKTNIDSGTPNILQYVGVLALQDMQHIQQVREEYREKRDIMMAAFAAAGLPATPGDATFYLWQQGKPGMSGVDFATKLIELGIVVTPGAAISETVSGINPGQDFVRFALVPPLSDVQYAAECIRKMA
ncbi:aminotransferase class I/II-fold pyridoxal phosphate-dependent enzyme [Candidatus Haliotispira prima]|uniref:Aminotransferase class I/II-fold pyridoxal phosphate-dependent enzyme n=1 Tax=Candidatus Haliotispira prima TaxID=3034016 RepID=A0ABY8MJH6_9SPIO|nr:aminotransferase class I/II-fold pyridoxal phosphate-dependent enzyme [Candidatus Haliotispira prima]